MFSTGCIGKDNYNNQERIIVLFFDIFEKLCKEHRTTPSAVCIEIGYSKATASYWKRSNGVPKREALEKIADYFGVTVDYLLGKEQKKTAPVETNRSELFAILARLTDAEIDDLLQYSEFLLAKRINQADPKFR